MLNLKLLIDQFGHAKTAAFLRQRFQDPAHFFEFTSLFSETLVDDTPPIHRRIVSEYLQGGRVAVCAPRGGAKSTVTDLEYLGWVAVNGLYTFIVVISDTFSQAKLHVQSLRNEFETNEKLRFVYPGAIGSKWGEEGIEINAINGKTVFILPLGAGMKVRGLRYKGTRPQLAIIDDLENLEIVYSAERRKKLQRWFDFDLEPGLDRYNKNIIYIGTILHYHSLLKQVITNQGKYSSWRTIFIKALDGDGKSFWESRYPSDYLKSIRDDASHPDYVGSIVFAQEYQNEPQDDNDRIIKLAWLKEYKYREMWHMLPGNNDEEREWAWLKTLERVGACDPAISEKQTADNFAVYCFGFDPKSANEYMLDLEVGKFPDIDDQVGLIVEVIVKWKLEVFGIETVAYQSGLAGLVRKELQRKGVYCHIVPLKTDKDKIRRARIHSSAFEAGFVHLRQDHRNYGILKQEIEEFPIGEHDDTFDALMLARETRRKPQARVLAKKPAGL